MAIITVPIIFPVLGNYVVITDNWSLVGGNECVRTVLIGSRKQPPQSLVLASKMDGLLCLERSRLALIEGRGSSVCPIPAWL